MKALESLNYNVTMIERKMHEPEVPIKNKRRWQLMLRYLKSIGYT